MTSPELAPRSPHDVCASKSPHRIRHIHIESGALTLDFQASADQAQAVANELAQGFPEFIVTVDDVVPPNLPPLPCGGLWD